MKKLLPCLLLVCLCLTGCATLSLPLEKETATLVPGTNPALPEAQAPASLAVKETAVLYFRYMDEPYLAPETRQVTHSPSKPFELSLLTELISGPGSHSSDLTALFPPGTRVLSTVSRGRTLFVTLSREIMDGYPNDASASVAEQKLRRRLCMQSLVATVTENCEVDQVQILVEQEESGGASLRLQARYFLEDDDASELVGPMTREEALLLSPLNTARVMLSLWQSRDWQRLYRYIARRDPATGTERISYRDFVTAMENMPMLTDFSVEGGGVNDSRATLTLSATVLEGGRELKQEGRVVRLCREDGLWRATVTMLTGWMEE